MKNYQATGGLCFSNSPSNNAKCTMFDRDLQERIILDNLVTYLRLDIEYPLNGYMQRYLSSRYFSHEIKEDDYYELRQVNDKLVCSTKNRRGNVKFPLDVISICTNSEEIQPPPFAYLHRVSCCYEDCEVDFYLKVVKTLNKIYNCNIDSSDYGIYSLYDIRS